MADDMDPSNVWAHMAAFELIVAVERAQLDAAIRIYESQTASATN